jgi:hypothetical protein
MEVYKIFWEDKEVGQLINPVMDMWYIEGDWKLNEKVYALEFDKLLRALEIKEVLVNYQKGLGITFNPENEPSYFGRAIAFGLTDEKLLIRRVFTDKAL